MRMLLAVVLLVGCGGAVEEGDFVVHDEAVNVGPPLTFDVTHHWLTGSLEVHDYEGHTLLHGLKGDCWAMTPTGEEVEINCRLVEVLYDFAQSAKEGSWHLTE